MGKLAILNKMVSLKMQKDEFYNFRKLNTISISCVLIFRDQFFFFKFGQFKAPIRLIQIFYTYLRVEVTAFKCSVSVRILFAGPMPCRALRCRTPTTPSGPKKTVVLQACAWPACYSCTLAVDHVLSGRSVCSV